MEHLSSSEGHHNSLSTEISILGDSSFHYQLLLLFFFSDPSREKAYICTLLNDRDVVNTIIVYSDTNNSNSIECE